MSSEDISHIVVIGGGQAGGHACKALRGAGYQGNLTVVTDEPHDFYERPPLSKGVITEGLSIPRLFTEESVAALEIDWRRPLRAVAIDREASEVVLDNGECLPYDRLLIATGSRPRLPVAEWGELSNVFTLRSWEDARRLKERFSESSRLGVIGGGWIGLEVAASARKLGLTVEVFECQSRLCERSVSLAVSEALAELHQERGVILHLGCQQLELTNQADGRVAIATSEKRCKPFDLVVVGTGVAFNLELAKEAGLVIEQGIVVDAVGRTSDPMIFAAGDVAQHPQLGLCLQSWAFAQNQAVVAAKGMLGEEVAYNEPAWLWSDQYGVNIQILGIPQKGAQEVVRKDVQGLVIFSLNEQGGLVQIVAFDHPRSIKLGKRWIASGRILNAVQLADSTFDLMSLR
ncbi:NAD(P)/FAD-dependent oxidoreductase [Vreelandella venusta]|uniref:NAD(P)/FAD-dependent oxidoreductase n=1 Tax=Vreelandella venusta TaxID=44935 RepID=UPI003C2C6EA8